MIYFFRQGRPKRFHLQLVSCEPRIILKHVAGKPDPDNYNVITITIEYEIRSVNTFFNMVYPFYLERGEHDSNSQLR